MSQAQLFEAGEVRILSRWAKYKTTADRNVQRRKFIAEMTCEGWIRFHPRTKQYYEVQGQHHCKVAHPHLCAGGCGGTVYASRGRVRRHGIPICEECRCRPYQDANGYILVWVDGVGRKSEHRWIMEQILGRELTEAESVHHINGDRTDNRIENLQLRHRHHGRGQAYRCCECGSENVEAVPIKGGAQRPPDLND